MYLCIKRPRDRHGSTRAAFYCVIIYFVCAQRLAIFLDVYADGGTSNISRDAYWFFDVRFPRYNILLTAKPQCNIVLGIVTKRML